MTARGAAGLLAAALLCGALAPAASGEGQPQLDIIDRGQLPRASQQRLFELSQRYGVEITVQQAIDRLADGPERNGTILCLDPKVREVSLTTRCRFLTAREFAAFQKAANR